MSNTLLHIDSSLRREESDSRRLSRAFVQQWLLANPTDILKVRDIVSEPLPHIDYRLFEAASTQEESQSDAMRTTQQRIDELVEEFLAADVVVIGVPMYNFGIPSTLKAWVDHIAQAGRTFKYTEEGPQGLAGDKQVYLISTRGGVYDNSPLDHQVAYLKTLFGFLGVTRIEVIQAEGLNLSPESRSRSLAAAESKIVDSVAACQAVA